MTHFSAIHTILPYLILLQIVLVSNQAGNAQNIIIRPYLQDAENNRITIMWETDGAGDGFVNYGLSPFDLDDEITSTTQVGNGSSLIHQATITGLSAETKYYYRVETQSGQLSSLYHFQTPHQNSANAAIQLVAISDMQRDNSNPDIYQHIIDNGIIPIIQSEIDTSYSSLEAILIPGDLVATGGTYSQWQNHFFNPSDSLTPFVPLYPVPGNHEYFGGGLVNFLKYFELPENGPIDLSEQCWFKDISNVRVIGLNSNSGSEDKALQLEWLETVLEEACLDTHIDFVFAELHHPYKSELWLPGESDFTGDVISLLESFTDSCGKASLHFFGHTHGYSRGQSRDHQHLWVNVATAGGNIDYWGEFANADYAEFVKSQDEYGFVFIESVAGDDPEITLKRYSIGDEFVTLNNVLRDEITIRQYEFSPALPSSIFPDMDTIEASCLALRASEFNDYGDIHQASHWQISMGCNFSDSIADESWEQNENWYYEIDLQAGDKLTQEEGFDLEANKWYCWRVRYRDQYLKWSEWSSPKSFYLISSVTDLTSNIVINGGAEDSTNAWIGDIESLLSNECNSVPAYQGNSLFAVGGVCTNEMNIGTARQIFDLDPYASQIDSGNVFILYSAYMRDFSGSDVPELFIEFYEGGSLISSTTSITNATPVWTNKTNTSSIPTNASSLHVVLKGTRFAGTDNDSYFDDIFAKLFVSPECPDCLTDANGIVIDADGDGYCINDDCNDQDSTIFPGALEICDSLDNDCDGLTDAGETVTWTGNGNGYSWEDAQNWDQQIAPLPCQHAVITGFDSVHVSSNPTIKSILIDSNANLTIGSTGLLTIDSDYTNSQTSAVINGFMINHGKCFISKSQNNGLVLNGTLINHGKFYINQIVIESLNINLGGTFIIDSDMEARN